MKENVEYAWLQISDVHIFGDSVTEWNVLKQEIIKIKNIEDIRFILITGDLHQYGNGYQGTIDFLDFLRKQFSLEKNSIFIVPGNHDSGPLPNDNAKGLNKNAYTAYIRSVIEDEPDVYQDYFESDKLAGCFKEYIDFIYEFYGEKNPYYEPEQICVRKWYDAKNPSIGINIVHLNTAIICNDVKNEKCIIDINKLSKLSEQDIDVNFPTIIMAHHPFKRLAVSHQNFLVKFCARWKVKAYLCGDKHKQMIEDIRVNLGNKLGSYIPCVVCGRIVPENGDNYSDIGLIVFRKYKDVPNIEIDPYIWNRKQKGFQPYVSAYINGELPTFEFGSNKPDILPAKAPLPEAAILASGESIWLPDAEKANGKQTRFDSFTKTKILEEFLADHPSYWGVSAAKGVGKTFVLQVKRARIDKSRRVCLPLGVTPSSGNGWGTDSVKLNDIKRNKSLKNIVNVKKLWQYSIIVYVINQLCQIKDRLHYSSSWDTPTPEEELLRNLKSDEQRKRIDIFTYDLCTNTRYMNLNDIIHGVLSERAWVKYVANDIGQLVLYRYAIIKTLNHIGKESLAIFIDKVDQAVTQTKAERVDPCQKCEDFREFFKALNGTENENDLESLTSPCYTCKKAIAEEGRIYSSKNNDLVHVSVWQYLQIGLLWAIDDIREEFKDVIEVYFTIRQEAFASEEALFGADKRKVTKNVCSLIYTREEQNAIFLKCIEDEWDSYLYNPKLKRKPGKQEEAFVGVERLCHPYVEKLEETVFESIYRHSFDRARDIQDYGKMLSEKLPELRKIDTEKARGEAVKTYIENKAAELAFSEYEIKDPQKICYYDEKRDLLPGFWTKRENFKQLLSYFRKNLLFGDEAKEICRKFNGGIKCNAQCNECSAKHYPFSVLYKLGMLGKINTVSGYTDVYMEFCDAKDVTYINSREIESLNEHMIYVLHPALTKSIDKIFRPILHFGGFIIGKDLRVGRNVIRELKECYETQDLKTYEEKYFFKKG